MSSEFDLAITLLNKEYSTHLRNSLSNMYVEDNSSIINKILFCEDVVKKVVYDAIERNLDGIAL